MLTVLWLALLLGCTPPTTAETPKALPSARQAPAQGQGTPYYNADDDHKRRASYYASVDDAFSSSDGERLFRVLHLLISEGTQDLGYKRARRELYQSVDRRPDGNLYYLYSGEGPKFQADVSPKSELRELANYNCEHVVPQSWFGKDRPMVSDLHHLFTEESQCNARRGNLELTDVGEGAVSVEGCGQVLPGRAFEPLAGKGEVARATLYFLTRYPKAIGGKKQTSYEDLEVLLRWHEEFPVSEYERHRNARIHELQGNRNPYIDFPELAAKVSFRSAFRTHR